MVQSKAANQLKGVRKASPIIRLNTGLNDPAH